MRTRLIPLISPLSAGQKDHRDTAMAEKQAENPEPSEDPEPSADEVEILVVDDPTPGEIGVIDRGLTDHAEQVAEPFGLEKIGILLRDGEENVVGGLIADVYGPHGACHIKDLWVAEALRGCGAGSALMERLEEEVRGRGCRLVHVDTFDFQAQGFYERHGFTVFGSVTYPKTGRTRHFMSKTLAL